MTEATRLFLEDLAPGQRFVAGPLHVSAEDIVAFARAYDPQPFHLDHAAATATMFGGLAASGWHTAAMTMRLITQALPLADGVIGNTAELQWPRPVRPGDALRVECEVLEAAASRSKPHQGWATVRTTTLNGRDEPVQVLVARLLVPRRAA